MPSYVITGASRGLGYEFIRQLAKDQSNVVIGLVRNKAATDKRLVEDGLTGVTIFEADITNLAAQQKAAAETAKLTGGSLDFLINNAAYLNVKSSAMDLADFEDNFGELEEDLTEQFAVNVVGVAKTIAAFLPLIKKSETKKVITISTGLADLEITNSLPLPLSVAYSTSKAALNLLIAKYSAIYGAQGILFMSISPGVVNTGEGRRTPPTPAQMEKLMPMFGKFKEYEPSFAGPITSEASVEKIMLVAHGATVEKDGGSFVSHHGNKRWI